MWRHIMRLVLVLTILLLTGIDTSSHANDLPDLDLGPVAQSCLTDPPAPTETFMVSLCESFAGIAREREAQAHGKIEATTCDAVCRYPIDKAREDREAIEAGKRQAAQWGARSTRSTRAARPVCDAACQRLNGMSVEELDAEIARMERGMAMMFLPPMPMMREPIHCTSYSLGMFLNTDCY
jgi:hypothetical protein